MPLHAAGGAFRIVVSPLAAGILSPLSTFATRMTLKAARGAGGSLPAEIFSPRSAVAAGVPFKATCHALYRT